MKCIICKQGETRLGQATATLEHDGLIMVVKGVPARVCANCGEAYVNATIADQLLAVARDTAAAGVQVDVREYVPA